MMVTAIVLADDHHFIRHGLRAVLAAEPDFLIAGEAADGIAAVALVERTRPAVLILDLLMPGLNGLEVLRQVRRRSPHTRTVVLSMHMDDAYVVQALRNGALGYVVKDASATELVQAVRAAVRGERYLSPPLSERDLEAYITAATDAPFDRYETLTNREREVLQLTAEGCTSAEAAARLSISPRTAEGHRANVMRKLGLQSQAELIRFALERELLPVKS